jgi:hypothetical protein
VKGIQKYALGMFLKEVINAYGLHGVRNARAHVVLVFVVQRDHIHAACVGPNTHNALPNVAQRLTAGS